MTGTWERCTIRLIFQWCTVIFDWYTWKVLCSFTQSLNPFLTFFFFQILLNSSKSDKCSCSVPFWRVIRPLERASAADTALPWIKLEIRSFNGFMTAYTKTWWFRLPFLGGCFGRILNQIWLAKESAPSIRWVKFAVQWALFMQLDVFPITISKGDEKIICIILQIMRRKFSNFLHLW